MIIKQMWFATQNIAFAMRMEVVFMDFILILIYLLGFSLTINVTLLTVILIHIMNKE